MDLSSYWGSAPCVSISQADAEMIKNSSTKSEEGDWYTGTLTVATGIDSVKYGSEYYTMSDFSSWGVPGSLELKPEITAPGGNIYSVNGAVEGGKSYGSMSGTSMAAPQAAGMAALLGQYIRENDLTTKTNKTERQLINSLLMSTAEPLTEKESGSYYSVLEQGAGLANIGNAINADSYIMMEENLSGTASDGKVKAELGDDPDRNGTYTVKFSVNNLSDEEKNYTFSTDIFTQAIVEKGGYSYLDKKTTPIAADVKYKVNGEEFVPTTKIECDVDHDGDTDSDDAQMILNYATGLIYQIDRIADIDGDNNVTSYDAYLLLLRLTIASADVEANGSVEVEVEIKLNDATKAYLDEKYANGAYIEGYIGVETANTEDGEILPMHSIPVLGFYGNWSDASMLDTTTYEERVYGDATPSYLGEAETNKLVVRYPGEKTNSVYTANPYMVEPEYPADRLALNSKTSVYRYDYSIIRNASAVAYFVQNESGEVIYLDIAEEQLTSAFYHANALKWYDTADSITVNQKPSSLGLSEGDKFTSGLVLIPEYYETNGSLDKAQIKSLIESGKLGHGAYFAAEYTVDDTAPVLKDVEKNLLTGDITVTAQDNEYIADVKVYKGSGSTLLGEVLPEQSEAGEECSAVFDLDSSAGEYIMIFLADYAGNEVYYKVSYGGDAENYTGKMYGFTSSNARDSKGKRWVEIDPETLNYDYSSASKNTGFANAAVVNYEVYAAEYVGKYVFFATEDGVYTAPQGEWSNTQKVTDFSALASKEIILDMAYNTQNDTLYAVTGVCSNLDSGSLDNTVSSVYSIDVVTGEMTKVLDIDVYDPRNEFSPAYKLIRTLAIDNNGTFYATNNANGRDLYLYKWTLDDMAGGVINTLHPVDDDNYGYLYGSGMYGQYYTSMTYDHDKNVMYFASGYGDKSSNDSDNILWVIDTAAGKAAKASSTYNSQLRAHVVGFYTVSASSAPLPSDTPVSKVTVSPANVSILKGAKTELTASVYPWLAPDKSVTWTSSNESIAKVENGVVYGVDLGQAVITVSSVSDSTKTAQCSVTVEKLPDIKLDALLTDNDGNSHWAEFDVNFPASYTYLSDSDYYFAGTMNNEEIIVHDGAQVYGIDPDTYEKTLYGSLAETWAWSDAAEGPKSEKGFFGQIVGICNGGKYIELLDAPSAKLGYFDLSETFDSDPMAVIAYSGSGRYDYVYSKWLTYDNCPANFYYVITEEGALYKLNVFIYDNDNKPGVTAEKIGYTDVELPGVSGLNGEKTASMFYESESGYLIVSSRIFDKEVSLYAVSVNDIVSAKIGTFGSDIASAVSLFRYDRPTDLTLKLNPTEVTLYKGDSTKIKAKVILGSTNELTWKSSDNTVATVENGVITGVSEGNATITATTVDVNKDGQHISAFVNVNIKSLIDVNATVSAQITDGNGTSWVDINLGSDMAVTVKKSGATKLNGGGLSDGYIYGSDALLEEEGEGNIYRIDADSFTEEVGADVSAYAILDLDDAPALEFTYTDYYDQPTRYDAFGMPLYITYSSDMAMLTDYTGKQNLLVWKFSESYPDLAAIAYIGDIEETGFGSGYDPGTIAHMYMLLGADGTLYKVKVTPMYDTSSYKVSYKTTRTEFGTLGISFTDRTALSMTYIELSADEYGLFIADAATGSIYYASMANTSGENVYLGKVGKIDGALDITSLYNARLNSAAGNSNASTEARVSIREAEFNAVSMSDDIAAEYAVNESKAVNKSNGSLNAAAPESVKDSDADADNHVLTVDVIEDVAVTNGKYTVTYDPAKVTFKSAVSSQMIKAFNVDETKGVVTFAFASDEAVAAGTTLATVTFEYGDYVNTEVTITVDERNDDTDVDEEPVVITIEDEVGDHDWEEIDRVEPTCTKDGYIVYKCTRCEETKTEVLKALGHNFVVEEGYAGLTRNKLVCSRCGLVISGNSPIPVLNPKTSPILNPTKPTTPVVEPKEDDEDEEPVVEEPVVEPVKSELPFTDVTPEDWFYTAVEYLYNEGIMNGTSETEFSPEYELNRATVVTILYRLEGEPEVETAGTFSDVEEGEWYTAAVEWAASVGIVKGYEDGTFAPKKAVTREQLAAIIYRYAEFKGITIAETTAELGEEAVVSDWAKANVEWAVSEGLLVEGENVNATENANRAEVAAMIYTFLTKTSK